MPVRFITVDLDITQVNLLSGLLCEAPAQFILSGCVTDSEEIPRLIEERNTGLLFINGENTGVDKVQTWQNNAPSFDHIVLDACEHNAAQWKDTNPFALWYLPFDAKQALLDLKRYNDIKNGVIPSRVTFSVGQSMKVVRPENIIMVRADGAYSVVVLEGGEELVLSRNLKSVFEELKPYPFMYRSHKSSIVNLKHILECCRGGSQRIKLTVGHEAGLTSDRQEEFMNLMLKF